MTGERTYPETINHPETGEMMVLDTTQGADAMAPRLTKDVAIVEAGRQALERIREKEDAEGRIYVNPVTGYRARINPFADEEAAAHAPAPGATSRAATARR